MQTWQSVLLGIIEGLTEFIPVSSTGHLLLVEHFLGVKPTKRVFEVLIQLGAVLAILTVYAARLWQMLIELPSNPETRRFVIAILVAFLPAVVIGVAAHKFIKEVLFETPMLICITLIVGGVILLIVDRLPLEPRITEARMISIPTALIIGLCQCVAMIPGVSRSGATIVGGMLLGLSKRAAAEFSFFLAMPTMAGAFAYDLYKSHADLDGAAVTSIAIGFVAAFIAGVIVVRYLLEFVSRYGFAPFAWWRIAVGGLGLGALLVGG